MLKLLPHKKIYIFIIVTMWMLCCSGCMGPPRVQEIAEERLREENVDETLIRQVIRLEDMRRSDFLTFSQHLHPYVRCLIGANEHTPPDILAHLAKDDSTFVMQSTSENSNLPDEVLQELLNNESLLRYLVRNPKLSEETILKLYEQHKNISISSFAANPNCPEKIKEDIRKSGDYLATLVIKNNKSANFGWVYPRGLPQIQEYAEKRLHEDNVPEESIQRILGLKDMTRDEFLTFSQHPHPYVRALIGDNKHTPPDILARLATDYSDAVMLAVTRNPNLSDETINELLQNKSLLRYLVANPKLSRTTILEIYHNHKDIQLFYFAKNPNCPEEIKKDIRKSGYYTANLFIGNNKFKEDE